MKRIDKTTGMVNIGELKAKVCAVVDDCEAQGVICTPGAEELVTRYERSDVEARHRIRRLSGYSGYIAEKYGIDESDILHLELAAVFHDVGMMTVPHEFFNSPHSLTVYQYTVVKTHTTSGGTLLSGKAEESFRHIRESALFHHETFDGTGYPIGLKGNQIPFFTRIISLVDTFDILTSSRPHKEPYPFDMASDIIFSERKKYDPDVLSLFSENLDSLIKIKHDIEGDLRFTESKSACELSERDKIQLHTISESAKN
jgi:putative two-component system response regulator